MSLIPPTAECVNEVIVVAEALDHDVRSPGAVGYAGSAGMCAWDAHEVVCSSCQVLCA